MITSAQYAIDGTAIKIAAASQTPKKVFIHAVTTGDLYIGGSSAVTSATGFLIDKAAAVFEVQVDADDELWGITGAGTHTFTVLQVFL